MRRNVRSLWIAGGVVFSASGCPIHFTDRVSTEPADEPITVAEAKNFLRVFHADEDTLIGDLIREARQHVERLTGRAILTQSRTLTLDIAPSHRRAILLPTYPVSAITSITSYSTADAGSTVATSVYRLDSESFPPRIVLKDGQDWPSGLRPENALSIVYVAGYGTTPGDVKELGLLTAIRLLVSHWYERRSLVSVAAGSTVEDVPFTVTAMTNALKLPWL
jgi:uncharacterized phiE125 gp8 family phage protein